MKLPSWINTAFAKSTKTVNASVEFNMQQFKELIEKIKTGSKDIKLSEAKNLMDLQGLINHHQDRQTKKSILAICEKFEHQHELHTAKKLTAKDYNVIFVPHGYFKWYEKKFDVFLSRGHILLESDLKCIRTTNTDTIGNRIKEGSEQARRVVLDITSSITKRELIIALKTGCERNEHLLEIMMFYNSIFYILPKSQILSKKIFDVIK